MTIKIDPSFFLIFLAASYKNIQIITHTTVNNKVVFQSGFFIFHTDNLQFSGLIKGLIVFDILQQLLCKNLALVSGPKTADYANFFS